MDPNPCPALRVAEHVGGRVHDHLERRLDQREAAPVVPVEDPTSQLVHVRSMSPPFPDPGFMDRPTLYYVHSTQKKACHGMGLTASAVGERITLVWSLTEPQWGLDLTSLSRLFGATAAIITRHE